jgi:4-hydroxy-tetrahydrodipicolinate reductase
MNIAIIGFGKMGKAINEIALSSGHKVVVVIDSEKDWTEKHTQLSLADVAIEFSTPDAVVSNIQKCFEMNLPVVTGTTAWEDKQEMIIKKCVDEGRALFVASNFSLGVNLFFKLNHYFSKLMNGFAEYDVKMEEIHHIHKLDKPSGTAKTLAGDILQNLDRKVNWVNAKSNNGEELSIISHRTDNVPGTHSVIYTSNEDVIELRHTALNRKGFAKGAVHAATWLIGKKGYFGMQDLLADSFK